MLRVLTKINCYLTWLLSGLFCLLCVMFAVSQVEVYDAWRQELRDEKVLQIYDNLVKQTGLREYMLPLVIEDSGVVNAYCDGTKIVIYRGMLEAIEYDQDKIALILAHEISHNVLKHTDPKVQGAFYEDIIEGQVSESVADKLGAVYALKAGYSVCRGREVFLDFDRLYGEGLRDEHPTYSYRYEQLNLDCE